MRALRIMMCLFITLVFPACLAIGQAPSAPQPFNEKDAIADIVQARELAYGMVVIATDKFIKTSPEYENAKVKYAFAQSAYSGWETYLVQAIRDGSVRHLSLDPSFKSRTATAQAKLADFVTYVQSTSSGQPRAIDIATLTTNAVTSAINLWFNFKDKNQQVRTAAADAVANETKWGPWDAALKPATEPSKAIPSTPTPTTTPATPPTPSPRINPSITPDR
jgi:hypothetical protein